MTSRDLEALSLTSVVIVGAGHAGVQAAASLREQGFDGEVVLLSAEKDPPYQRPPLSKAFLKGEMDIHGLPLRADAHFREQRIDLRLGVGATRIDRAAQQVELSDGGAIAYGHLILATGARQRRLDVPGVDLPGVFALRDIADATAIRERLGAKPKVVIIGAGFIGLEIAATAASLGAEATVVEIARPMGRAVSPIMSDFFLREHAAFGARFRLGVGVAAIKGRERAETVILTDGEALSADLVVVGIGVVAEDALAQGVRPRMRQRNRGRRVPAHLRFDNFGDRRLHRTFRMRRLACEPGSNRCRTRSIRGARSPRASWGSQNPTMNWPGSGAIRAT